MNDTPCLNSEECIRLARATLLAEAEAIQAVANRVNGELLRAVEIVLGHSGKIVVTGLGKSGHIGQKLAATLSSTGTPAIFLHAAEAVHGDLGVYTPGDPTILLSKSGTTLELLRLIPILRQFDSALIGIIGNLNSPLARQVDVVLDARVEREADTLNLAPTASSTVALALGDALAVTLMKARGFEDYDFARFHPGGQLGKNLWLHVADVMQHLEQVALVSPEDSFRQVVIQMTRFPLGAACVIDGQGQLLGIITDGDVRRKLYEDGNILAMQATDVMTVNPITIQATAILKDAIDLMENRKSQISVLPVVDPIGLCLGLLRLHDVYQADLQ